MDTPSEETLPKQFQRLLELWMEHKKCCFECGRNPGRTSCTVGEELLESISQLQWQMVQGKRKTV